MPTPFTEPQLLDALARGVRVVLPNNRAARALRRAFDDRQRATGAAAWESAPALSWADWTRSLWSALVADGAELRLLLNPAQEHTLWREIIASATTDRSLSSPDSLAELARSAFHLAAAHQALPRLRSSATTSDSRTFAAWAESFARLSTSQNCLSSSQIEAALVEHALANSLHLDTPILLAGFSNPDDLTPAQNALLDALRSTGTSLETISLTAQEESLTAQESFAAPESFAAHEESPTAEESLAAQEESVTAQQESVISTGAQRSGETCISPLPMQAANPTALRASTIAPTPREELQLAAHWIRRFLETHTTPDHTPRLAVLLPQPEDDHAELEQVFREILAPELQSISADLSSTPWEFVSGAPLASQPMVVDALDLLRWTSGPLPLERVSALLLSPFLGSSAARLAAARFDAHFLRDNLSLVPELDLASVRRFAAQEAHRRNLTDSRSTDSPSADSPSTDSPIAWLQPLADVLTARLPNPATRSFADWAELFRTILRAANWPRHSDPDHDITASEFETSRAWDSTLDLLATLDFRGRRVSLKEALQSLERLVQTARVTAPSAHAPIEIMQPREAGGSVFDAIVLLRATDDAWPEPQRLHPLLGWPLQVSLNLPGANSAHDTAQARTRAESLLRLTTHLLTTSAAKNVDGDLRPSPLLQHLNLNCIEPSKLVSPPPPTARLIEDLIPDDTPLPPLPAPDLRGGATVLKQQAACGFLAFAELRLNAKSPEPSELGLDPGQRGNLVHNALDAFWRETTSQAELISLTTDERSARLNRAIDEAFTKIKTAAEAWSTAYLALQRERLHTLLSHWLDQELHRGPFTVLSREAKAPIEIGPLRLQIRPDRIDRIENADGTGAGFALIDYKTGYRADPANWLGDRPDDPQLPLYALLHEPDELKALLFAKIRPGKDMRWLGLASGPGVLSSIKPRDFVDLD
ncbi:MAG TPA: PD-(D/E)XK nuclease family protein, partial [Acidobacteriaceae bacterium]